MLRSLCSFAAISTAVFGYQFLESVGGSAFSASRLLQFRGRSRSRFKVQGSRFKVQSCRLPVFPVFGLLQFRGRSRSRFKVQGSRFNGSRFKVQASKPSRSSSDEGLDCGAWLAVARAQRMNHVATDCSRHDEGFGVVDRERLEFALGTFDHSFIPLDQV